MKQDRTETLKTFRVHMQADQVDVDAATSHEARAVAAKLRPGALITKVKVLKEGAGE